MRLLFIGFNYHEYTKSICDEFDRMGFETVFHDIQPNRLPLKIARRVNAWCYREALGRYHDSIIESYPANHFDCVVFLQVHQFDPARLARLKARQSRATFVLYNWDAVTTHDYRPWLDFFDHVFTFDPTDAAALGICYLPLFATRRYQTAASAASTLPASVYFIGNIVNPERYRMVRSFEDFCRTSGIGFRCYLSTTVHGWTQMVRVGLRPRGVSLRPISEMLQDRMLAQSSAVFDFANHRQAGFTMRVMENLCAGRKIITNNPHVADAPFFSEDRLLIYRDQDFSAVPGFLARPLADPGMTFPDYHVQTFARRLLGLAE